MATPRYATPVPRSKGWTPDIEATAVAMGTPLMPWQGQGARYIGARRQDGTPRFKTVGISVPRQQGKTILVRAGTATRAEQAPDLDLFYTAQSRIYASRHVVALGDHLEGVTVRRGVGNEFVRWDNNSELRPVAPNEKGGHGDSIDWFVADEGWTLISEVLGGIRPAMIARPYSQLVIVSTMGTLDSEVWNGIVARGRDSVDDPDSDIAWLEFSAPTDNAVFEDTCKGEGEDGCVWGEWMPALGITVTHRDIRLAIDDMLTDPARGRAEVVRAFGNRTVASLVTLFPSDWVEDAWKVIAPAPELVVAVDVNDEPPGAYVALAHMTDDGPAVRLGEWAYGSPAWVPGKVLEIIKQRKVLAVAVDTGGPARQITAELKAVCEEHYIPFVDRKPREFGGDCAGFYDDLRERRIHLESNTSLVESIAGAARKDIGDLWLVARRRMTVDASPVVATITAAGVVSELAVTPRIIPAIW